MLSGKDCADNVRGQQRETEQPRHIGRDYTLRLGNFVQCESLIRKKPIPDRMGADENTHQAGVRSFGFGTILDEDLHLFADALETSRNS